VFVAAMVHHCSLRFLLGKVTMYMVQASVRLGVVTTLLSRGMRHWRQ
jgi:hypothetical protein